VSFLTPRALVATESDPARHIEVDPVDYRYCWRRASGLQPPLHITKDTPGRLEVA
jgi:hypothetical protein